MFPEDGVLMIAAPPPLPAHWDSGLDSLVYLVCIILHLQRFSSDRLPLTWSPNIRSIASVLSDEDLSSGGTP